MTGTGDQRRLRTGARAELDAVAVVCTATTRVAELRWLATRRRLNDLCTGP